MSKRYNQFELGKGTLTETEKSILICLIEKKESSRYEISTATNHAYSGIYNAVRNLLENGLINISRKDKGQRNPKIEVEYYGITPLGVVCFLRASVRELNDYLVGYSLIDVSFRNKWLNVFDNLLNNHSYIFPEEFLKLSRKFALVLCVNYCFIHAYGGEDPTKWGVIDAIEGELTRMGVARHRVMGISLAREYMSAIFLQLIETKTNKVAPTVSGPRGMLQVYSEDGKYIKSSCQLMSGKDLEILVEMVEKITLIRQRNHEETLEQVKKLLTYLKDVKSDLSKEHEN